MMNVSFLGKYFFCATALFYVAESQAQNLVNTYAGTGSPGFSNGVISNASFNNPFGMCIDKNDNIYVADQGNNCIRKINTADGTVETLAGTGLAGWLDGPAVSARFNNPTALCADDSGNIYVADFLNQRIRKISADGMVSTVAGNGTAGFVDGNADLAQFNYPRGLCRDKEGNLYVSDSWNHRIRKISISGVVSTYAGGGAASGVGSVGSLLDGAATDARFYTPCGLAIDELGNIYVADAYNHRIRKIDVGRIVTTLVGNGLSGTTNGGYLNGDKSLARLNVPTEVFVDTMTHNLYISDTFNNRIRKTNTSGSLVSTFAGNGSASLTNAPDTLAAFDYPRGVVVDASGLNVYVSDFNNHVIRRIAPISTGWDEWATKNEEVLVFPNPSDGLFQLSNPRLMYKTAVLYDASGRKIKEYSTNSQEPVLMDLSAEEKGNYYLLIRNEDLGNFRSIKLINR